MSPPISTTPDGFPRDAWELFRERLTPARSAKLARVAASRTRRIRLVLQDLHDFHNIAACLRSAEAFGIAAVDVVDRKSRFLNSTVSRGARDWLIVKRWGSEQECAAALHADGYRIIGAYPDADATPLPAVPVTTPLAVVFGNEKEGLSPEWKTAIDERFTIPMVGMVESFNISVAAAITLYDLTSRARTTLPEGQYHLSDGERRDLLCGWVCRSIPHFEGELERLRSSALPPI